MAHRITGNDLRRATAYVRPNRLNTEDRTA